MGLSIGYDMALPGSLPFTAVQEKLEALRQECLKLPFERVDPAITVLHGTALLQKRSATRPSFVWGDLSFEVDAAAGNDDHTRKAFLTARARRVACFKLYPGPHCETTYFGVAKLPKTVGCVNSPQASARNRRVVVPRHRGRWYGEWCTKTQYAGDPRSGGVPHFLKRHLALIAALDAAVRLGFEVDVGDDGGYWVSRSPEKLVTELCRWNVLVARMTGRFKDQLASQSAGVMLAPISSRPDFEHVEAGFSPPSSAEPWPADVRAMIDLTKRRRPSSRRRRNT
ncbi:MAG: hypothetical protein HY292_07215 [Planctomycetes bacterium]|nr:hypothetical protein [Planctomycetota bacterium]